MIAFITDWGLNSYYVSSTKSVIKQINNDIEIIDITHNMMKYDINSYSNILYRSSKDFEKNTIFLAVIDPTVGSERKPILLVTKKPKYFFIAPDNGILTEVLKKYGSEKIIHLNNKSYYWKDSITFHGRDIFGSVAGFLSKNINIKYFGDEINEINIIKKQEPNIIDYSIYAEIIYKDSFGNLETNIEKNMEKFFEKNNEFEIYLNNKKYNLKYKNYYSEGSDDELFVHFDSSGFLELSLYKRSAYEYLKIYEFPTKFQIRKVV